MDVLDALLPRLAPKRLHQRRPIEPAFVGRAVRSERDAFRRDHRKPLLERMRIEQLDGAALAFLDRVIGAQHRLARRARKEEIARLLEAEIDLQKLARMAQESDSVARQMDVERRRELLADRSRRERR